MEIMDTNGRIGVVVDDRGDCLFAIPLGQREEIDAIHTGIGRSKYMTATPWHRQADGSYRGIWFDAPIRSDSVSARISGDVRERLVRYGQYLYGSRWQSDLARSLSVGDRRVREWVSGERRPPAGIWVDIAALLRQRQREGISLLIELDAAERYPA